MNGAKIFIGILIVSVGIKSQVVEEWVQRYNETVYTEHLNNDKPYPFMDLDASGNVYIAGSIDSEPGQGQNPDFVVIKYNSSGILQWTRKYDGPAHEDDYLSDMKVDDSGNVFITGSSYIDNGTLHDFCTIKYNTNGVQQWINLFDSPSHYGDIPVALDINNTGTVCIAGRVWGGTEQYVPVIKISPNGNIAWSKIIDFNAPAGSRGIDITFDYAGNIVALFSFCPFEMNTFCLYKFNPNGDSLWCVEVGHEWRDGGTLGVKSDNSDNLYITGNSTPYFSGWYLGYSQKISPSGYIIWSCGYSNPAYSNQIIDFCIDNAGSVFTAGCFNQSGNKYLTSKFNNGIIAWTEYYTYSNYSSIGKSIDIDGFGYVYVTGSSIGLNTNTDYATIKYNQQGDSIWVIRYNHSAGLSDGASAVKVDTSGNVYVTGTSKNSDGTYSYATVKYNQLTGIHSISNDVPNTFSLSQNYPNPFNPSTKIKFSLPLPSKGGAMVVRLVFYDVLGREIANLIPPLRGGQEGLSPGTYEVKWDASNYPSGVYFYKLVTADYSETKKMVVVK